jgi:predicted ATPase
MRELALRGVLAPALAAIKSWGSSEVRVNAEWRVSLCRELGDNRRLIPALYNLRAHHVLRGNRQPAFDLAAEIARLAETPEEVFIGYSARVIACFYGGRFSEMMALAKQAAALYEPGLFPGLAQVFGGEASLLARVCVFWTLWIVGRPEEAVRERDAVLATAEALRSPFILCYALLFDMILWRELREPEKADQAARRLASLSQENEFAFLYATAQLGLGWAACQRGDLEGGTARIRTGLELYAATGARLPRAYYMTYLLDALLLSGSLAEGLAAAREALTFSETQLDVYYDAEVLRLRGELLRASGDAAEAEASFRQALDVARAQAARTFELRAAAGLGRLLAEQGRAGEALPPLAAAYAAFQEGFATRDLQEARELLDRLSSS